MKKVGIWIDKREAKIVRFESNSEQIETILSDIEDYNIGGGSGTKLKGGPQDVVQDSKYLERENHQLTLFFKNIVSSVENADQLVIFGPAQTGEKLQKEILEKYKQFKPETVTVRKADNMTDNQVIAWTKDYFSTN